MRRNPFFLLLLASMIVDSFAGPSHGYTSFRSGTTLTFFIKCRNGPVRANAHIEVAEWDDRLLGWGLDVERVFLGNTDQYFYPMPGKPRENEVKLTYVVPLDGGSVVDQGNAEISVVFHSFCSPDTIYFDSRNLKVTDTYDLTPRSYQSSC